MTDEQQPANSTPAPTEEAPQDELGAKREALLRLHEEICRLEAKAAPASTNGRREPVSEMVLARRSVLITKLEAQLKQTESRNAELVKEKLNLEKVFRSKDLTIQRQAQEISTLNDKYRALESQLEKTKAQVKSSEEERKMLSDFKAEMEALRSKPITEKGPNVEIIAALNDQIKLLNFQVASLEKDTKALNNLLLAKDKALHEKENKIQSLLSTVERLYELEGDLSAKNVKIEALNKALKRAEAEVRQKSQAIDKIVKSQERSAQSLQSSADLKSTLRIRDKKIKDLEDEIRVLTRANERKEREILRLESTRDDAAIRMLEGDKSFLNGEIKKLNDQHERDLRTIKWLEGRVEQLTSRLDTITTALRDTKVAKTLNLDPKASSSKTQSNRHSAPAEPETTNDKPAVSSEDESTEPAGTNEGTDSAPSKPEMIDIALYELLQKQVSVLSDTIKQKEAQICEKDVVIETLEKDVDVLRRAKESDAKTSKLKIAELLEQIASLTQKLDTAEQRFKEKESSLKKQKFDLMKKINRMSIEGLVPQPIPE